MKCFCLKCDVLFEINLQRTCFHGIANWYNPNESYQLNCLLALVIQLMGGGCVDGHVLLSFLDLPHGKSMGGGKLHQIEQKLSPIICQITSNELDQALEEEICLQLKEENRVSDFVK